MSNNRNENNEINTSNAQQEHSVPESKGTSENVKKDPLNTFFDLIEQGLESLADKLDQVEEKYKISTYTFDQLAAQLEPSIDQDMLTTAKEREITALGGELLFTPSKQGRNNFNIDIKLYFIDDKKRYTLIERSSIRPLKLLTTEAQTDLQKNAPIKYPINAPKS